MRNAVILSLSALLVGGACLALQGPVPGDVALTLGLQSAFGPAPSWAKVLTDTAKPPLAAFSVLAGAGLAWVAAGWRAALAAPLAFGFGWVTDKALRAAIFAPRPTSDLVEVASASSSSGLPSTFGLAYGSIFGVVLFAVAASRPAFAARALAGALIIAGAAARVVLGGHWASQMLVSVLLGLLTALVAQKLVHRIARAGAVQ